MNDSTPHDLVDRVEATIRELLKDGIALTADVCRYIQATLGEGDPEMLADFLAHQDGTERDTLLELIFFPDMVFQQALEAVLAGRGLPDGAPVRLAARLKEHPARAALVFPENGHRLACDLPVSGVASFLGRLNLEWEVGPDLLEALQRWGQENQSGSEIDSDALLLLVKLRNAELGQTRGQVRLLAEFLERMPPAAPRWAACFDFLMAFLPEHADTHNFYRALMDRKRFFFQHLMKARRDAEIMARSNMETLSMSGFRASHFDVGAAEQALACIDTIALAVYGRTECFDDAPLSVELGRMGSAPDIEGIVKRLL